MTRPVDRLRVGEAITPYRIVASNTAAASENKIHDDTVARAYGFRGGLVPGVTVYAYLTHPVVETFGVEWLGRGSASVRFLLPTYEGEEVAISGQVTASGDGETALALEARNPSGDLCAVMTATLPDGACEAPPDASVYRSGDLPETRPPASVESLSAIDVLGTVSYAVDAARRDRYSAQVGETLPVYGEKQLLHPGDILSGANAALASNVLLGPWIHVSSELTNYSLVREGDLVEFRGTVAQLFERKGHKFVELDLLVVANGDRPAAAIRHTAIYEPRRAS